MALYSLTVQRLQPSLCIRHTCCALLYLQHVWNTVWSNRLVAIFSDHFIFGIQNRQGLFSDFFLKKLPDWGVYRQFWISMKRKLEMKIKKRINGACRRSLILLPLQLCSLGRWHGNYRVTVPPAGLQPYKHSSTWLFSSPYLLWDECQHLSSDV